MWTTILLLCWNLIPPKEILDLYIFHSCYMTMPSSFFAGPEGSLPLDFSSLFFQNFHFHVRIKNFPGCFPSSIFPTKKKIKKKIWKLKKIKEKKRKKKNSFFLMPTNFKQRCQILATYFFLKKHSPCVIFFFVLFSIS